MSMSPIAGSPASAENAVNDEVLALQARATRFRCLAIRINDAETARNLNRAADELEARIEQLVARRSPNPD
jgi:hypothetical protein